MYQLPFYLLFLVLTAICHATQPYELSICAIFQNEAPYLKEWIEFHRLVGVEHFYLYNHHSKDHYQEILQPYIQKGIVELQHYSTKTPTLKSFNQLQCKCYSECSKKAQGKSKWIAFLDIDEFLFSTEGKNLQQVLKDYEEFGGIGINWLMFGPSHVWQIPPGQLLIETLTLCAPKQFKGNRYVKSIVRPEKISYFKNPHQPLYKTGYSAVNTDKLPIEGMWSNYITDNRLRINHYWTRDGHYFYHQKMQRHQQWRGNPDPQAIQTFIQNMNQQTDTTIFKFIPQLKIMMNQAKI